MARNLFDFSGKTVLITGGASGIGRATALAFAKAGANIVIGDIREEAARETIGLVKQAGAKTSFVRADVSKPEDAKKLVDKSVEAFGTLDYAFNNGCGLR